LELETLMHASFRWLIGLAAILVLSGPGFAQTGTTHGPAAQPTALPTYVPPMRGSPNARISGASRGAALVGLPHLEVLAPDHAGETLEEQPTFFWSTSRPVDGKVELAINAVATERVLYKTTIPGPKAAGIYAFSLTGTSARLDLNSEYRWSVTTIVEGTDESHTITVSGLVKRVPRSEVKLTSFPPDPNSAAIAYARAGLWYDAVEALSLGLQQTPSDARLHRSRAALLRQVGLPDVADFDRAGS
jgi:hypothetical protein